MACARNLTISLATNKSKLLDSSWIPKFRSLLRDLQIFKKFQLVCLMNGALEFKAPVSTISSDVHLDGRMSAWIGRSSDKWKSAKNDNHFKNFSPSKLV